MDKFIEASKRERFALLNILPLLFKNIKGYYTYYFTDVYGMDIYDAYVMVFDNETHSIIGRYIIECKVRDKFYPDLMLEKKKYFDLKNKSNESNSKIIYISVTPEGTYCYNLSKLITDDTNWIKEEHWISTMDKSKGKKNKRLIYINVDKSKKLNINTIDINTQYRNNKIKKELAKEIIQHKNQFCLFRDVFGYL